MKTFNTIQKFAIIMSIIDMLVGTYFQDVCLTICGAVVFNTTFNSK